MTKPSEIKEWNAIAGYLYPDEGDYLYNIAAGLKKGSVFVEVGVLQGRSTAAIGLGCKESSSTLSAIDHFLGNYEQQVDSSISQASYGKALENITKLGILDFVLFYPLESFKVAELFDDSSVDAIFIDAGHTREDLTSDFNAWFRKVKTGGHILVHDVGTGIWTGVDDAVRDFKASENVGEVKLERTLLHLCKK